MDLYTWILLVLPDWVMAVLMMAAAGVCWRRFRRRGRLSALALFLPLVGATVFYWWGLLFSPEPLPWIGGGRVMVFGLGLGILLWGLLTRGDD